MNSFRRSSAEFTGDALPSAARLFGYVMLFDALVVTIAILIGLAQDDITRQFKESGLNTLISFMQLLLIAWLAWKVFRYRKTAVSAVVVRPTYRLWALIAAGFVFLALDEVGKIHENLDNLLHKAFSLQKTPMTDRIDDLIIVAYAVIGLAVLYHYRAELMRFRGWLPYFALGFALLFVGVVLDTLSNNEELLIRYAPSLYSAGLYRGLAVAEDAMKVFAEGAFVAGTYLCYLVARRQHG
jgi:hypothetical protein